MANKNWDDIPYVAGDCVRDVTEWNNMVDYIRHSSCTDFTIYKTCPTTTQTHKFTWEAGESIIEGGANTGEDLAIRANSNDASPEILLQGNSDIEITGDMTFPADNEGIKLGLADDIHLYWDGAQLVFDPIAAGHELMSILSAAGRTTIYGGQNAGDDLYLFANTAQAFSSITLLGNGELNMNAGNFMSVKHAGTPCFKVDYAANVTLVEGSNIASDDLTLKANTNDALPTIILEGAGDIALNPNAGSFVKFGTHVGTGDVVSNGHIIIEDSAGNQRKIMTTA